MRTRAETKPLHRLILALGILATVAVVVPDVANAQSAMTSGNVEISAGDSLASGNSTLSALAGSASGAQILEGSAKLHLNQRLTFKQSELYLDDTLSLSQGVDGSVLANEIIQGYLAVTPMPALTVIVGKRRLPWGYGYAFAPGDRMDPPPNPQDRSEGFYGATATLSPSASLTMTGAVRLDTAFPQLDTLSGFTASPSAGGSSGAAASLPFLSTYLPSSAANPWARLRYSLYLDNLFGNLDSYAAVTYQWERVLRPVVGFSLDLGGFIANGAAAIELSNPDLYPAGTSTGGAYQQPAFGKPFPLFTVGLQRTLETNNGSFGMTAEYLYDGTGYDATQAKTFYGDLMAALAAVPAGTYSVADYVAGSAAAGAWLSSGEGIPRLGRNYAAMSISASITKLFSVSVAGLVNLQDGSFAVQPEVRFTRLSGVDLFARGIITWGRNDQSEFGLMPTPLMLSAGAIAYF